MIKLLKSLFKAMIFVAKAAWFCIIFVIIYALARDYIEGYIEKKEKTEKDKEKEL